MEITKLLLNQMPLTPEATLKLGATMSPDKEAKTAEQLRSTAQQFETIFLHQILKQMKETVDYGSLDEEDESGEQFQSLYWSFMADNIGSQGGLGFWKTIYNDLATAQGIDPRRFPAEGGQLDERA
jgi:Rod binding domain-containing protein